MLYHLGLGTDIDEENSKKYYKKAYKLGDPSAAYALGDIYFEESDYVEAVKCYEYSAEKGIADAQVMLGYLFEKGIGVDQSYDNAKMWMKKASEQGKAEATEWIEKNYDKNGKLKLEKRIGLLCEQFLDSHKSNINYYIPSEKQLNIFGIHHEKVFIAHDDTVFQNGKNGFVITEKGIYDRGMFESTTNYHSFKELSKGKNLHRDGGYFYVDGNRVAYMTGGDQEDLVDLLVDIVNTCKEYY